MTRKIVREPHESIKSSKRPKWFILTFFVSTFGALEKHFATQRFARGIFLKTSLPNNVVRKKLKASIKRSATSREAIARRPNHVAESPLNQIRRNEHQKNHNNKIIDEMMMLNWSILKLCIAPEIVMAARTIESLKVSKTEELWRLKPRRRAYWNNLQGTLGERKANSGEHVPYRSFLNTAGSLHFISRQGAVAGRCCLVPRPHRAA